MVKRCEKTWYETSGRCQGYFLLQAANLTLDNEQLVRATTKIDYDDMKNQIQKVFGDTVGNADHSLPVKTEESN